MAVIATADAPQAIGPYSQAIKVNDVVYLSGQIPLDPETMEMVAGDVTAQALQAFNNLQAVARAAGGELNRCAKVNIFLTDLNDFNAVNEVMKQFFDAPFPARACVQVAALPRGAQIELDAIMVL
jgi:reactive intermediate/imine deaminase